MTFIFGSILGSFLLVLVMNWGNWSHIFRGRSSCDSCGHMLGYLDLIPVLSYLMNKGHCRYCGSDLSINYFIIEIYFGLIFLLSRSYIEGIILIILSLMALMDIYHLFVPDLFQLLLLLLVLLTHPITWAQFFYALLVGSIFMVYYIVRSDWIGGADVKLFFILALIIPPVQYPLFLFLASVGGLITYALHRQRQIPFVPAIAFAYGVVHFFYL